MYHIIAEDGDYIGSVMDLHKIDKQVALEMLCSTIADKVIEVKVEDLVNESKSILITYYYELNDGSHQEDQELFIAYKHEFLEI